MKRKFFLLLTLIGFITGCNKQDDYGKSLYGTFVGPEAPEGAITTMNDNYALTNGGYTIAFEQDLDGAETYGVYFYEGEELVAYNNRPARITIRGKETYGMYKVSEYSRPYDSVKQTKYGYHCVSLVTSKGGSKFRVMDSYYISHKNGFSINRKVTVIEAKAVDVGFESQITLKNGGHSQTIDDFDVFIPSTVYKDAKYNASSALVTSLYNARVYVKETRMGLPMTMIWNRNSKQYMSIVHQEPNISVHDELGGGTDGAVDDDLEYGSLGFENEYNGEPIDIAISMCYPCAEGPATFDSSSGWCYRFHEVGYRHYHEYKVGLVFGETDNFNDALVDAYEKSYLYVDVNKEQVSNKLVYDQTIDCFDKEYVEITSKGKTSAGVPWVLNVDPEVKKGPYSFQMGFVGQQTSVGAHLYRQGLIENNDTYKHKGETIVNFWTSENIFDKNNQKFPYIWWEGASNTLHGQGSAGYAVIYLRMLCDGLEGILDAYEYGVKNGVTNSNWLQYVLDVTDNIVDSQNSDGSFNRAFDKDGNIPQYEVFGDKSIGYDSADEAKFKINTPIVIKLLCRLYKLTKDTKYYDSARLAAEYSYTHIYEEMGKYVGGTCDNPNVVDKEAAIYAMFGFRSAFELFGDEKYQKAMRHATCCSLSWTLMYDFACPANEKDEQYCPYLEGNVMGTSVIATGHASVDGFSAYIWYDIYKCYEATGNITYKKAAIALQNAVKHLTDYDGSLGWRYPCLIVEACQVSDFVYRPTDSTGSLWLPWCSIAQINPIIYTYDTYGVYQLEDIVEE